MSRVVLLVLSSKSGRGLISLGVKGPLLPPKEQVVSGPAVEFLVVQQCRPESQTPTPRRRQGLVPVTVTGSIVSPHPTRPCTPHPSVPGSGFSRLQVKECVFIYLPSRYPICWTSRTFGMMGTISFRRVRNYTYTQ